MLPLKIILYTICFISLTWSAIIFAGPAVLKKIIVSYSNGQMVASNVAVTPKLDIKIGRLDYAVKDAEDLIYRKGFSRSVNIFWSVFGGEPLIKVQIGPTFLKNTFLADSLTVNTPSFEKIDFQKILLSAEIAGLDVKSIMDVDRVKFKAFYQRDKGLLNEVFADLGSIGFGGSNAWSLASATASTEQIDLTVPIDKQNFIIKVFTEKLENTRQPIQLLGSEGILNVLNGELVFNFELRRFLLGHAGRQLEKVNAEGVFSKEGRLKNARIEVLDNSVEMVNRKHSKFFVEASNVGIGKYYFRMIGDIEATDLTWGENFLGNLPASNAQIELRVDSNSSKAEMKSQITFKNAEVPMILGNGELSLSLDGSAKIFDCFSIQCEIISTDINYKINSDKQWISGVSMCISPPCSFSSMYHKFQTSNTKEILEIINRSKILNPIYTTYIYALIIGGKKIETGHEIVLN